MDTAPPTKQPTALPQIQCRYRLPSHTCALIDVELGWQHGCPPSICHTCQTQGDPDDPAAVAFREGIIKDWIQVLLKHPEAASESHVKALRDRHLTPGQYQEFLTNPEVVWALSKVESWAKARPSWEQALAFGKALLSRGFTGKKVDLTIKGQRHISCFGETLEGKKVQDSCPSLTISHDGAHHYCNACGCGDKGLTHLEANADGYSKLDFPYLECPRKRPGFSNAT